MRRTMGAALIVLSTLAVSAAAQERPLLAGRDVDIPKKLDAPLPAYPPMARSAGLQGLIVLEITLSTAGQPTDIKVLRGIPLLDHAAVEAVKAWRYEPTLVHDVPQRVVVLETIEFFESEGVMAQAYADMATNRRQPALYRVHAISRLLDLPPKRHKMVAKTLQKLLKDPNHSVASAAESGLMRLPAPPK